jgi:hypothetical protein
MSAFQFSDPGRCHDTEVVIWKTVFVQRLQELGWTEGRNLVIDSRFGSLVRPFYSGGPLLLTDAWIDLSHCSDRGDHVYSLALGPALAQQKASRHDVNLQSSIRSFYTAKTQTGPRPG